MTLAELKMIKPIGSDGAWNRWSFAWAQILSDSSGGRFSDAVRRQATLSEYEIRDLLTSRSRLDEFINFTYQALKSHRDGQIEAARLDSAEGTAPMLDVVFALAGRLRPYNKYLAWELRELPLPVSTRKDDDLMRHINGLLEGNKNMILESFLAIERECRSHDEQLGQSGPLTNRPAH